MNRTSLLVALCVLVVGCEGSNSGSGKLLSPRDRLIAAQKIGDTFKRDAALVEVSERAAEARDVATVTEALTGIGDSFKRDAAAEFCALELAEEGDPGAAKVAEIIGDVYRRDAVLAKVASTK